MIFARRFLIITSTILFFYNSAFAQLSGTKTIGGTNPDYATFSAAVTALNSIGVNGPVVFNVAPGVYNEQFVIASISGASATNTITFQSSNGDSTSVILKYATGSSATGNYVIKLNGTDYITFKAMTIKRFGAGSFAMVIRLDGVCDYVSFDNNVIMNDALNNTSNQTVLIYAPNGGTNSHNYSSYSNNHFKNGAIAIYHFGPSNTQTSNGTTIINNTFENQGKYAMQLYYQNAPFVSENTIVNTASSSSSYAAFIGNYIANSFVFENNKLALAKGIGLSLQASSGNASTGLITNNFISIVGVGTGIILNNSGHQNIYYNSIRIGGVSSIGAYFQSSATTANRFKNNIIQMDGNASCMKVYNSPNAFFELNYNNYYFPNGNMGKYNNSTNYTTLAAWKTATSKEANSLNFNPNFISLVDLHILSSSIALQGTSANTSPFNNKDIDGQTRHITTPDIGADEFSISDIAIDSIRLDTNMCNGNQYVLKVDLKNTGNATLTAVNVPIVYTMILGGAIQAGIAQIASLSPGAVYTFTAPNSVPGIPVGNHVFRLKISMVDDADSTNNYDTINVAINDYPQSKLPNDTSVCGGKTLVLDPGSGYSYLWFDGSTNQTYSLDSTGIGYGGKYISVIIDNNGCSIQDSTLALFLNCTSIENMEKAQYFQIYPNPSSDYIQVKNETTHGIKWIEIIRMDGQIVRRMQFENKSKINVSELAPGVYYLRIFTADDAIIKKFIKE